MMKRLNRFLILILAVICICTACGDNDSSKKESNKNNGASDAKTSSDNKKASDDDMFVWNENHTEITGLTEKGHEAKELVIPKECKLLSSLQYENKPLYDYNILESISFEGDDTEIAEYATPIFWNLDSLKEIDFPKNATKLPHSIISDCSIIEKISLPENLETISRSMFKGCSGLKEVSMGDKVQTIEGSAFKDCTSLKEIRLSPSIATIGQAAFWGSGLENIELPEGVKELGVNAFYGCKNLKSVSLPQTLEFIGAKAFYDCNEIESFTADCSPMPFDMVWNGSEDERKEGLEYFEQLFGFSVKLPKDITLIIVKGSTFERYFREEIEKQNINHYYIEGNSENQDPENKTVIGSTDELLGIDAEDIKTYYDMAGNAVSKYIYANGSEGETICVNDGFITLVSGDGMFHRTDMDLGIIKTYAFDAGKDSHDKTVPLSANDKYIYFRDANDSNKPVILDTETETITAIDDEHIDDVFSSICCFKDNVLFCGEKDKKFGIFVYDKLCDFQKFVEIRDAYGVVSGNIITDGDNLVLCIRMSSKDTVVITLDAVTFTSVDVFTLADTGIYDYFPDDKFDRMSLSDNVLLISYFMQLDGYYYAAIDCNGPAKNVMFKTKEKLESFHLGGPLRYIGSNNSWNTIEEDASVRAETDGEEPMNYSPCACLPGEKFLGREYGETYKWFASDYRAVTRIYL